MKDRPGHQPQEDQTKSDHERPRAAGPQSRPHRQLFQGSAQLVGSRPVRADLRRIERLSALSSDAGLYSCHEGFSPPGGPRARARRRKESLLHIAYHRPESSPGPCRRRGRTVRQRASRSCEQPCVARCRSGGFGPRRRTVPHQFCGGQGGHTFFARAESLTATCGTRFANFRPTGLMNGVADPGAGPIGPPIFQPPSGCSKRRLRPTALRGGKNLSRPAVRDPAPSWSK
jgi:hypothetical protein